MNKKISLSTTVFMICIAVLLTFMITFVNANNRYNKLLSTTQLNDKITVKLAELDKRAREIYISEIDDQKIIDSTAQGYVLGLGDRYAEYMNAERYAEYMRGNQGKLVGIGVEVLPSNDRGGVIEVTAVMPDSPAKTGGMLEGDYIYKIEGELVSALGYYESVNKVKGEKGTALNLTILRGADHSQELELSFIRDEVKMQTVKSRMINGNIGYIRIKEFNQETPNEFLTAMNDLKSAGAVKYIFDVRYNPGGDLKGVSATLNYLLPEGPIIRYVYKNKKEEVITSDAETITNDPMVVLINESTASAAELFCSALKDYDKAKLVGTKTYGKGTMQGIYTLSDRITALKVSNAKYYPPFSDSYDGIGVFPSEGMEVTLPEELLKEKSFEKLTDEEDTQLQTAIKVLE